MNQKLLYVAPLHCLQLQGQTSSETLRKILWTIDSFSASSDAQVQELQTLVNTSCALLWLAGIETIQPKQILDTCIDMQEYIIFKFDMDANESESDSEIKYVKSFLPLNAINDRILFTEGMHQNVNHKNEDDQKGEIILYAAFWGLTFWKKLCLIMDAILMSLGFVRQEQVPNEEIMKQFFVKQPCHRWAVTNLNITNRKLYHEMDPESKLTTFTEDRSPYLKMDDVLKIDLAGPHNMMTYGIHTDYDKITIHTAKGDILTIVNPLEFFRPSCLLAFYKHLTMTEEHAQIQSFFLIREIEATLLQQYVLYNARLIRERKILEFDVQRTIK